MDEEEILNKIINDPDKLSPKQEKAVKADSRHVRVIAGAGAGKTETITRRILYLLLYEGVDPGSIVAFTFTEKAAQSMKSRVFQRVKELMGENYLSNLSPMYIGTIHSYALQILQDYFGMDDYEVLDENQEMAFIMRRGWDIGLGNLEGSYNKNCKMFRDAINVVYHELLSEKLIKDKDPQFYELLKNYEEILDQNNRLTFGSMIYKALEELTKEPDKLEDVKHLIVDEYQDINHAQEEFIQTIGQSSNIFVVGDPRQCIYQWRGSDDSCFDEFKEKIYPDAECISIPENRRSTSNIVKVANKIADSFTRRDFPHMDPIKDNDGHVHVVSHETPHDEARWIVNQIENYVDSDEAKFGDFGILLRSISTSAGPFIQELKRHGIPYIIGGKYGLFKREEATAVGKLFVWLTDDGFWVKDQYDWSDQIGHDNLLESAIEDWETASGISLSEDIKEELESWKNKVIGNEYSSYPQAYYDLLVTLGYQQFDSDDELDAALMANLGRFSDMLVDYENAVRLGGNKIDLARTAKGLCWYINMYASGAYEEQISEDIRGIDAVQLTTIHQAKGLEWPIVFIPALVKNRFPTSFVGENKDWMIPRNVFPADRYDTELEDEKRLFYVAFTRAKNIAVLSYFQRITQNVQMSDLLKKTIKDAPEHIEALSTSSNVEIESLDTGGDEEEIQTFEAGELVDYRKCPYFYRLRHLWDYKAEMNEYLGYGNALHFCLRYAAELVNEKGMNPLSAIFKAVDDRFYLPYAPDEKEGGVREGAERILSNYVANNLNDMKEVKEVEYRLEFPMLNSTIAGKVDVIIDKEEEAEVREYKTSTDVTNHKNAKLQVKLYALGLRELGHNINKGSIVYLQEEDMREVEINDDILKEARYEASILLKNILNGNYAPSIGDFCEKCDYFTICEHTTLDLGDGNDEE